jgi:hypothetical protein
MPAGLQQALSLLEVEAVGKPIIILLSDGMPNIGLNGESDEDAVRQQVLDLATQAHQRGICIYTVGFGDPTLGSSDNRGLDEDFLRQVAKNSDCGTYQNARDSWQLANVYIGLRHASTGTTLLQRSGDIAQGQTVDVGPVQVPPDQALILFTLNWPGSRLEPRLTDPSGRPIDSSYPGASVSTANALSSAVIQNPAAGLWHVSVQGVDVPEGSTKYNVVLSARAGRVATSSSGLWIFLILILVGGAAVAIIAASRSTSAVSLQPRPVRVQGGALLIPSGQGGTGRPISLLDGLLIGRSSSCGLRLADPAVSRRHARLRYGSGRWYIQDLNSAAGTLVNGAEVNATALRSGDRIQIGSSEFEFRE